MLDSVLPRIGAQLRKTIKISLLRYFHDVDPMMHGETYCNLLYHVSPPVFLPVDELTLFAGLA